MMAPCKAVKTFESVDGVTNQMKPFYPYIHMMLFVCQHFTKWNFEALPDFDTL